MDSVKTDEELTSTVGNVLSTSNKEEKNDTSDATPTSSTDANTNPTASRTVSDDPISSTSSDNFDQKIPAMNQQTVDETNKTQSTDNVNELLELPVSNEKITEDVEDLVHDLESLLGETSEPFNLPLKQKEDGDNPSPSEVAEHNQVDQNAENHRNNERSPKTDSLKNDTTETQNIQSENNELIINDQPISNTEFPVSEISTIENEKPTKNSENILDDADNSETVGENIPSTSELQNTAENSEVDKLDETSDIIKNNEEVMKNCKIENPSIDENSTGSWELVDHADTIETESSVSSTPLKSPGNSKEGINSQNTPEDITSSGDKATDSLQTQDSDENREAESIQTSTIEQSVENVESGQNKDSEENREAESVQTDIAVEGSENLEAVSIQESSEVEDIDNVTSIVQENKEDSNGRMAVDVKGDTKNPIEIEGTTSEAVPLEIKEAERTENRTTEESKNIESPMEISSSEICAKTEAVQEEKSNLEQNQEVQDSSPEAVCSSDTSSQTDNITSETNKNLDNVQEQLAGEGQVPMQNEEDSEITKEETIFVEEDVKKINSEVPEVEKEVISDVDVKESPSNDTKVEEKTEKEDLNIKESQFKVISDIDVKESPSNDTVIKEKSEKENLNIKELQSKVISDIDVKESPSNDTVVKEKSEKENLNIKELQSKDTEIVEIEQSDSKLEMSTTGVSQNIGENLNLNTAKEIIQSEELQSNTNKAEFIKSNITDTQVTDSYINKTEVIESNITDTPVTDDTLPEKSKVDDLEVVASQNEVVSKPEDAQDKNDKENSNVVHTEPASADSVVNNLEADEPELSIIESHSEFTKENNEIAETASHIEEVESKVDAVKTQDETIEGKTHDAINVDETQDKIGAKETSEDMNIIKTQDEIKPKETLNDVEIVETQDEKKASETQDEIEASNIEDENDLTELKDDVEKTTMLESVEEDTKDTGNELVETDPNNDSIIKPSEKLQHVADSNSQEEEISSNLEEIKTAEIENTETLEQQPESIDLQEKNQVEGLHLDSCEPSVDELRASTTDIPEETDVQPLENTGAVESEQASLNFTEKSGTTDNTYQATLDETEQKQVIISEENEKTKNDEILQPKFDENDVDNATSAEDSSKNKMDVQDIEQVENELPQKDDIEDANENKKPADVEVINKSPISKDTTKIDNNKIEESDCVSEEDKSILLGKHILPEGTDLIPIIVEEPSVNKALVSMKDSVDSPQEIVDSPQEVVDSPQEVVDSPQESEQIKISSKETVDNEVGIKETSEEKGTKPERKPSKLIELEFAPLQLSEDDDSDEENVPRLALTPDDNIIPSPDLTNDTEPQMEEILEDKSVFIQTVVPPPVVETADNLETMLAVASLQNIDIPKSDESNISEKERREMEALAIAVQSITDTSSSSYEYVDPVIEPEPILQSNVESEPVVEDVEFQEPTGEKGSIQTDEDPAIQEDVAQTELQSSVDETKSSIKESIKESELLKESTNESNNVQEPASESEKIQEESVSQEEPKNEAGIVQDKSDSEECKLVLEPEAVIESKIQDKNVNSEPVKNKDPVQEPLIETSDAVSKATLQSQEAVQEPLVETSIFKEAAPLTKESEVDTSGAVQEPDIDSAPNVDNVSGTEDTPAEGHVADSALAEAASSVEQLQVNEEIKKDDTSEISEVKEDSPVDTSISQPINNETPEEIPIKVAESTEKIKSSTKVEEKAVENMEPVTASDEVNEEPIEILSSSQESSQDSVYSTQNEVHKPTKENKTKNPERTKKHRKSEKSDKLEELTINVDVPDKEKPYSPKVTIKPIKVPDEEVSTTTILTDSEVSKGSLKMTITKQSDNTHSILKISDQENSEMTNEADEPIPKLIIKPKIQQMEQHSPKISTRSSRHSPTSSSQRSSSPRITIKPVVKQDKQEQPVSPLKIKINTKTNSKIAGKEEDINRKVLIKPIVKPDESEQVHNPRITIKPIPKPESEKETNPTKSSIKTNDEPEQVHSPRITIKPIPKPDHEKEASPRLTIKPIKKPEEDIENEDKERSSPKITIKPIVKPPEAEASPSQEDEEVKERIVLKINKGNLPSPVKESKKREHSTDEEKSEKLAKITVKFSKEGGHPHIVHQQTDEGPLKRSQEEPAASEKNKKQKVEVETVISTRSRHSKEHEVNENKSNPISELKTKNKDSNQESPIEAKRPKKDNPNDKLKHKDVDQDEVHIVEPKAESPIVISEDSRSQDSSSVILLDDSNKEDSMSSVDIIRTADILKSNPKASLSGGESATPSPVPRKRGRPKKSSPVRETLVERETGTPSPVPKKRGRRPMKSPMGEITKEPESIVETEVATSSPILKKKMGRPRKTLSPPKEKETPDKIESTTVEVVTEKEPVVEIESTTPVKKKMGRPRKVPLEVRKEANLPEESPKPKEPEHAQQLHESGRPKRSCRGQSVCDTLGIKPRKPRGGGRGRGSMRGMGNRPVAEREPTSLENPIETDEKDVKIIKTTEATETEKHTTKADDSPKKSDKEADTKETTEKSKEIKETQKNIKEKTIEKAKIKQTKENDETLNTSDIIVIEDEENCGKKLKIEKKVAAKNKSTEKEPEPEIIEIDSGDSQLSDKVQNVDESIKNPQGVSEQRMEIDSTDPGGDIITEQPSTTTTHSNPHPRKKSTSTDQKSTFGGELGKEHSNVKLNIDCTSIDSDKESSVVEDKEAAAKEDEEKIDVVTKKSLIDVKSGVPFSILAPPALPKDFSNLGTSMRSSQIEQSAISKSSNPDIPSVSSTTLPSEVMIVDEETRMSAETNSRAQTPAKQVVTSSDIVEESQSSVHSTGTTESGKTPSRPSKAPRLEVQETDNTVMTADLLTEYYWNGNGPFMLQEQVAQFLGIKSFKRKYPGIMRRMLDMQERDYIREQGLASENMCDLGLTAVNAADILDIMYSDFQEKYEEYCKHQRDRQAKELINKQKALSLAATQEKCKADITQQAVHSAAQWNARFNKTRREQRKTCMDLQNLAVHYPKGKMDPSISAPHPGNYPVALVPGQFAEFYEEFTPTELNNFPINTMCYDDVNFIPREESEDSGSEGSESDSDSSGSSSSTSDSDSSSGIEDCKLCKHSPKKVVTTATSPTGTATVTQTVATIAK